jgi:hypothetical protein
MPKNGYNNHTHNHCQHDSLQYCSHCDLVYCENCGREWGQKVTYTYTVEPYIWTYRGIPYTVTYTNGDYSLTTTNGTMVKDNSTISAFYSTVNKSSFDSSSHSHTK